MANIDVAARWNGQFSRPWSAPVVVNLRLSGADIMDFVDYPEGLPRLARLLGVRAGGTYLPFPERARK